MKIHMLKRYVLIAVGILALALAGILRFWGKSASAETGEPDSLRSVAVALVERGPLLNSVALSGEFRAFQQIDVHAKVAGFIRKIYVDVGDHVKAGQVLAILEVPELSAEVTGAKADIRRSQDAIQRAQSEIERSQSAYGAYHAAYTRLKQASESRPGLIAEQELDDSLAKDKEAEAQVSGARAALAEAGNQLAAARANLERLAAMEAYSHITAPFAGVVTKRYADTGSLIQAGTASDTQSMPVVQLAEWSKLRLVVPVPESAVQQLRLGSIVRVHVSALQRDFEGTIARFADSLNDETRTMHTEIDVENSQGTLMEGMYAEVKLVLRDEKNALSVPIQAVQRNSSGASVLLVDAGGRIQEREVKLGTESSDRVEVLDGLTESDRVVIGNRGGFHPGDKVRPKVVSENADSPEGL
jgi:RND family efflux transporter MFP subunit